MPRTYPLSDVGCRDPRNLNVPRVGGEVPIAEIRLPGAARSSSLRLPICASLSPKNFSDCARGEVDLVVDGRPADLEDKHCAIVLSVSRSAIIGQRRSEINILFFKLLRAKVPLGKIADVPV